MTDQQQPGEFDPARFREAFERFGEALGRVVSGWAAQGALGFAYNADYKALTEALQGMSNEQIERTGRAARILQAACDLEQARPTRR